MKHFVLALMAAVALSCTTSPQTVSTPEATLAAQPAARLQWPAGLPVYDHVVIVME
jgi:hypothetical protein